VLVDAALAVGPRVPGASRGGVVVHREALGFLLAVVVEVAGAGFLHAHERAADIGQWGKSPHQCRYMMVAFFERCPPCWGHHSEALRSRCGGAHRVKTPSFWTCDSGALASYPS
jgi:hypothetical protein